MKSDSLCKPRLLLNTLCVVLFGALSGNVYASNEQSLVDAFGCQLDEIFSVQTGLCLSAPIDTKGGTKGGGSGNGPIETGPPPKNGGTGNATPDPKSGGNP